MLPAVDVRARIEHLLRLAADDGAAENEARNAAVVAARLIKKHGFEIAPAKPAKKRPGRDYQAEARKREELERKRRQEAEELERKRRVMEQEDQREAGRRWSQMPQRRIINSYDHKYCLQCGEPIPKGLPCNWVMEFGLRCIACALGDE